MSNTLLEIKDLHVSYNNIKALKGIDIKVNQGEIVALLGANGAGKSTTLRTVSGLVTGQSGQIMFDNQNINGERASKIAGKGIIQSPEGRKIFPELTVEENLKIGAFTIKDKAIKLRNFKQVYDYFPRLLERKSQLAGTLSGGEQQMLAIGRALMGSPKILLLDEPSLGLAPLIVRDIFHIIKEINEAGTTILIIEQNALQTLKIADYAYVLEVGRISIEGKAKDLIKDKKLTEAYLGGH